jgi:hypothetical protein
VATRARVAVVVAAERHAEPVAENVADAVSMQLR